MAGFDSVPNAPHDARDHATADRNARYGLVLFTIYLIVYGGFVVLSAFWPGLMGRVVFAGLNFAIVYGFGLIVIALVLAAVYGWLCRAQEGPK
jgi:uncharacterized membrane protein (DUF485 family)